MITIPVLVQHTAQTPAFQMYADWLGGLTDTISVGMQVQFGLLSLTQTQNAETLTNLGLWESWFNGS